MHTKIFKMEPNAIPEFQMEWAAKMIREGKTVAFPTETVYGIGADALNQKAVEAIFEAKGRPADNPLIVHIAQMDDVRLVASEVPSDAKKLMHQFWGGPLTVILKRQPYIPNIVTAGLDTVAIRMPSHPIANALITKSAKLIAAPSANLSGKPSPTTAQHVIEDLTDRVDGIIDGGNTQFGLESTVIDMSGERPLILRPGAITLEDIKELLPNAAYGAGGKEGAPKSPGMKYRHYAPNAPLTLVRCGSAEQFAAYAKEQSGTVGVISYRGIGADLPHALDAGQTPEEYGARLFYMLREFDHREVDYIVAVCPPTEGFGMAVYNRLQKAAGGNEITLE